MADKLVATGDNDADDYLYIAREVRVWAAALRLAEEYVADGNRYASVPWPRAGTARNPVGYTLAADIVVLAPVAIDSARERARQHLQAVQGRYARMADLVAAHAAHLLDPDLMGDPR
jgi:predicted RNA polymerase sigma factor